MPNTPIPETLSFVNFTDALSTLLTECLGHHMTISPEDEFELLHGDQAFYAGSWTHGQPGWHYRDVLQRYTTADEQMDAVKAIYLDLIDSHLTRRGVTA